MAHQDFVPRMAPNSESPGWEEGGGSGQAVHCVSMTTGGGHLMWGKLCCARGMSMVNLDSPGIALSTQRGAGSRRPFRVGQSYGSTAQEAEGT